jgi:hypothetical protein
MFANKTLTQLHYHLREVKKAENSAKKTVANIPTIQKAVGRGSRKSNRSRAVVTKKSYEDDVSEDNGESNSSEVEYADSDSSCSSDADNAQEKMAGGRRNGKRKRGVDPEESYKDNLSEESGDSSSSDVEYAGSESSSSSDEDYDDDVGSKARKAWTEREVDKFKELYNKYQDEYTVMAIISKHPKFIGRRTASQLQDKRKHLLRMDQWPFK